MRTLATITLLLLFVHTSAHPTAAVPVAPYSLYAPYLGRPDTRLAVASITDRRQPFNIYTMNTDGSGRVQLTFETTPDGALNPLWSPDGTQIAFTARTSGSRQAYVMRGDGTERHQITTADSDGFNDRNGTFVAWSPDSAQLVVGTIHGVTVFTVRGDQSPRVLSSVPDISAVAWSPDGQHIAFASSGIWVVDRTGEHQKHLTSMGYTPTWSPDGTQILYTTIDAVMRMNADGSTPTRLADLPGDSLNSTPQWSPDGRQIMWVENDGVYVMAADGTGRHRVGGGAGRIGVAWAPDSTRIFYTVFGLVVGELHMVRADGTHDEQFPNVGFGTVQPNWAPRP